MDWMTRIYPIIYKAEACLPEWLHLLTFLPAMCETCSFCPSCPMISVVIIFVKRCELHVTENSPSEL